MGTKTKLYEKFRYTWVSLFIMFDYWKDVIIEYSRTSGTLAGVIHDLPFKMLL